MNHRFITWTLVLFACFYGLGLYPLQDNNEGMYAAIARDMLASGDFVIPHLNTVPYIEKPPMLYWLMAGAMALFGVKTWVAHLVPALAFFVTAWLLARFLALNGRKNAGLIAALIFTTSLPLLMIARMILFDMLMTCFFTAALMQFYQWHSRAGSSEQRSLNGFYSCLALAVLTKGFMPVMLAGGTIALFYLWQRLPLRRYLEVLTLPGLVLFVVIAAPWHVLASLQEPGFAWFFFINEHLYRFLNLREPHDYYTGPPWYYLPRILAYLAPWTIALMAWLAPVARQPARAPLQAFLWSWFIFCFLFFSAAGGKANYYMIAGMPALIALLALRIDCVMEFNPRAFRALSAGVLFALLAVTLGAKTLCQTSTVDGCISGYAMPASLLATLAVSVPLSMIAVFKFPLRWLPPVLAANALCLLPALITEANTAPGHLSQEPVADYVKSQGFEHVGMYQEFEDLSALAFYMNQPLIMVDSKSSDLLYGEHHGYSPGLFLTLADWLNQKPPVPLIVFNSRLDALMLKLSAMQINLKHICIMKRFERVAVLELCPPP